MREHPVYMKKIIGETFINLIEGDSSVTRRQDNDPIYFPYGLAYIVKCATLQKERTFYPLKSTYYIIEPDQCYEIDSIQDFYFIEYLLTKKQTK